MKINLDSKRIVLTVLTLLLVVDVGIFYNIPAVRVFVAPLYFSVVIGFLLLSIFELPSRCTSIVEFILLSFGVNLSILFIVCLILNFVCTFFLVHPLSTYSIVIFLTLLVLLLCMLYVHYKSSNFSISLSINFLNIFLILISVEFLLVAILGTNWFDENNAIFNVICLFALIIFVTIFFIFANFNSNISDLCTSIVIYFISSSLLIIHSNVSYYLAGYNDILLEYYLFIKTAQLHIWSPNYLPIAYGVCISVSILPAFYYYIVGIPNLYIYFKIMMQFIISLYPVCIYYILRHRNICVSTSFLLTMMCIFQYQYISLLPVIIRTGVALVIFSLVILIFVSDSIPLLYKKFILILYLFSLVVSHYTTTYLTVALFILYLLLSKYLNDNNCSVIDTNSIMYLIILCLFWTSIVNSNAYVSVIQSIYHIKYSFSSFFNQSVHSETTLKTVGIGVTNVCQLVKVIVYDVFYLIIILGILSKVFREYISNRKLTCNLILELSALMIFSAFFIVPDLTKIYDIGRASMQLVLIMITGVVYTFSHIKSNRFSVVLLVILFLSLAFVGTGLNYRIAGNSALSPMYLSVNSSYNHFIYTYPGELVGCKWLCVYGNHNHVVYGDYVLDSRILLASQNYRSFIIGLLGNSTKKFHIMYKYFYLYSRGAEIGDYVVLRYFNIKYCKIYDGCTVHYIDGNVLEEKNLNTSLFRINTDKVYSNKYCSVYIFSNRVKWR